MQDLALGPRRSGGLGEAIGTRKLPDAPGGDAASLAIEVDAVTLAMMIGGVDLGTAKRRKRYRAAG